MKHDIDFPKLVKGLYEKTLKENIDWQMKDETTYRLQLPQSAIWIMYNSPPTEPDSIVVEINSKKDGQTVARWSVQDEEAGWKLASDLYSLIRRRLTGWDTVVADIQHFLGQDIAVKNEAK